MLLSKKHRQLERASSLKQRERRKQQLVTRKLLKKDNCFALPQMKWGVLAMGVVRKVPVRENCKRQAKEIRVTKKD